MGIYVQATDPESFPPFRWANVSDGNAIAIGITGMLIAFTALTLISVFIAALPKILRAIEPGLKLGVGKSKNRACDQRPTVVLAAVYVPGG